VKTLVVAFLAGIVFAVGLGISGMAQPAKVTSFLDFFGAWDPSLAFVMMGAIGAHTWFARRALGTKAPLLAARFVLPEKTEVDIALVGGAAIFGVGWGLGGYCPGPALVSIVAFAPTTLAFVGAMIAGMLAYELFTRARSRS
jgi:uncharacterized membrane protein YedE/YeeE